MLTLLRYVLGLLHWLVDLGVFKKIKLCFLPKGHTHNDVDQMFSCFSKALRHSNVFTLHDLVRICGLSYPNPYFVHLDHCAAISAALITRLVSSIKGHSKPRCFIIYRDPNDGVVRHKYRKQLQTSRKVMRDCWMPVNQAGFVIMVSYPDPAALVVVSPKPAEICDLKSTLACLTKYLSSADLTWWNDIIARFTREDEASCSTCRGLRLLLRDNASSNNDHVDVARDKRKANSRAYKDLLKHMGRDDIQHPLFPIAPFFPTPLFVWNPVLKRFNDPIDDDPAESIEELAFIDVLDSQQDEGHPCHFVGGDGLGPGSDARRRPNGEVMVSSPFSFLPSGILSLFMFSFYFVFLFSSMPFRNDIVTDVHSSADGRLVLCSQAGQGYHQ
jgi:hypothetical protein